MQQQTIKIKESLVYTKEQGLQFTTPKTTNSVRGDCYFCQLDRFIKRTKKRAGRHEEKNGPSIFKS